MIILYKQIFDLALYYAVSGLYFIILSGDAPGVAGFLLLILSAAAAGTVRKYKPNKHLHRTVLVIPLFFLLFRPTLWQLIQLLPAWGYLIWIELTGRLYTSSEDFSYHFSRSLWLLLLMLPPCPFAPQKWAEALTQILPYIVLMLSLGVCLLRILRSRKPESLRQSLIMFILLASCMLFCLLGIPRLLIKGLGFLWEYFFKYLLELVALIVGVVFFVIVTLFDLLIKLVSGQGTQNSVLQEIKIFGGEDLAKEMEQEVLTDPRGLRISLIILGCLAAAFIVFLILRALAGRRTPPAELDSVEKHSPDYVPSIKNFRAGLIRPSDPRMAVRFYLQKVLREGVRRGAAITPNMTVEEIRHAFSGCFPADILQELTELYSPARYSQLQPVSKKDAARAEALWHQLKKSEP